MTKYKISKQEREVKAKICQLAMELEKYKHTGEETGDDLWKRYVGVTDEPVDYSKVGKMKQLELRLDY